MISNDLIQGKIFLMFLGKFKMEQKQKMVDLVEQELSVIIEMTLKMEQEVQQISNSE